MKARDLNPTDLVANRLYECRNGRHWLYVGVDKFCGQVTYEFQIGHQRINKLPEQISSFFKPIADDGFKALAEMINVQHRAGLLEGLRIAAEDIRALRSAHMQGSPQWSILSASLFRIEARAKEMGGS